MTEMPFSYPDRNSLPPTLVRVRHNIGLQRKWIHLFSDAEAIIFIVDLTCYDQTVYSADTDEHLNRMRETMRQFESVCNFPAWLPGQLWILVMNKFDLFTEKLATVPFTECFPKYDGPTKRMPLPYTAFSGLRICPQHRGGGVRWRFAAGA
ncbi:G-protein alpha subunit-domain-containing protein [Mycena leptocephala]|nr:G-protein alpha subunit-domain-containing protein [Mycena leptocephala]